MKLLRHIFGTGLYTVTLCFVAMFLASTLLVGSGSVVGVIDAIFNAGIAGAILGGVISLCRAEVLHRARMSRPVAEPS